MGEKVDALSIENVIIQRMEGIKLKKFRMIREVIHTDLYSKFDDWPPGTRMLGEEALRNEEGALKVLDEYRYTVNDLVMKVKEDFAWASFYVNYKGMIRKRSFDVKSRVSMVLAKSGSQWRIVHEHFSMLPEIMPVSEQKPQVKEAVASEEQRDELEEAIVKVLEDGSEKHIADITKEVSRIIGKEVAASQVIDKCSILASKEVIIRRGRFYPRYKIRSTS